MKCVVFIFTFLIIAANFACQSNQAEPFFFIQMTDSQFGMISGNDDFQAETILFEKAIHQANQLKPAFVVVTGDLINQFGNEAQVQEFWRIAKQLDPAIPIYLVAGNHDVENAPTAESLKWYCDRFGKDCYSFQLNHCYFIVLNSTIVHTSTNVTDETMRQWNWLQAEIEKAKAVRPNHIFIIQHHPYFLENVAEENAYFNIPKSVRGDYLELFRQAGVTAIFSGHHHRNGLAKAGALEMIISSAVGKPLGEDPSGFRIVAVYPDQIRHQFFGLEDIPERSKVFEMLKRVTPGQE